MKKLALALVSTAIAATAASANTAHFTGPYAGLGLGMGHMKSDLKITASAAPTLTKRDLGGQGVIGGLELGYQKAFPHNFLLGLALNGDIGSLKGRNTTNNTGATFQSLTEKYSNSFGAALKLGLLLNPSTAAYIKVGVESAKWNLSVVDGTAIRSSAKRRLVGFYPALGFETKVCDRINAGIEGRYVSYRAHQVITGATAAAATTYRSKPSLLEARVKVSYQLSGFGF